MPKNYGTTYLYNKFPYEEKIFKFMTSSASGTSGETGTGIGLFVSKHLVDKIGSEISVSSVKDEGTVVRFSVSAH